MTSEDTHLNKMRQMQLERDVCVSERIWVQVRRGKYGKRKNRSLELTQLGDETLNTHYSSTLENMGLMIFNG